MRRERLYLGTRLMQARQGMGRRRDIRKLGVLHRPTYSRGVCRGHREELAGCTPRAKKWKTSSEEPRIAESGSDGVGEVKCLQSLLLNLSCRLQSDATGGRWSRDGAQLQILSHVIPILRPPLKPSMNQQRLTKPIEDANCNRIVLKAVQRSQHITIPANPPSMPNALQASSQPGTL